MNASLTTLSHRAKHAPSEAEYRAQRLERAARQALREMPATARGALAGDKRDENNIAICVRARWEDME